MKSDQEAALDLSHSVNDISICNACLFAGGLNIYLMPHVWNLGNHAAYWNVRIDVYAKAHLIPQMTTDSFSYKVSAGVQLVTWSLNDALDHMQLSHTYSDHTAPDVFQLASH